MPNQITATGLETQTLNELVTQFTDDMEVIFGSDISLDSDTPDGQMMNIFVQVVLDILDLITEVYNSMDPDKALGVVLDQRVSVNGIERQGGTYTNQAVVVTTDRSVTLYGLDQSVEDVYTVSDDAGTNWLLMATENVGSAGSFSLLFRAEDVGAVESLPNTITTLVSIVLGVSGVNNPSTYTVLGINEESDAILKVRRQRSVSLFSQGFPSSLEAALRNVTGVTSAKVYENLDSATNSDDVPGHCMWAVIGGTFDDEEIAEAIYSKRSSGCNMFGVQNYTLVEEDGDVFVAKWDIVAAEQLFISFTAESLDDSKPVDVSQIRLQLPTLLVPGVYEKMNINELSTLIQEIDENCLVTDAGFGFSESGPFFETLLPSSKTKFFTLSSDDIIILPILVLPRALTIDSLAERQFSAFGGFGAYTWSLETDVSGASISGTGLYTAGAGVGTDVIRATDDEANFTEVSIVVV